MLIASEADAEFLFGITGERLHRSGRGAGRAVRRDDVVGTRREADLVWRNRFAAVGYSRRARRTNRRGTRWRSWTGSGPATALAAGLIHGLLDGDLKKGLDYGAALGALKHTIPGDLPWIRRRG